MLFTPLRTVLFVTQLLVAIQAIPTPSLENAIEERSLEARAPITKFHLCNDINYNDCYYLATEPLTNSLSNSGCVNFKPEVASNIESIRVLDTWQYSVSIYEGVSCSGAGTTIMDSDSDLGAWSNRAKSANVYYIPIPHDSYPRNAV